MQLQTSEKIAMYTSSSLRGAKETGGVKRFKELVCFLPTLCDLTLISDDEDSLFGESIKHIRTDVQGADSSEISLWLRNRKVLREIKKQNFDHIIVFDVPPMMGLVLSRVPHLTLMVRKDLIGYNKILFQDFNTPMLVRKIKTAFLQYCEAVCLKQAEKIIVQCMYDKEQLILRHPHLARELERKTVVQINNVNPSWMKTIPVDKKKQNPFFTVGCVSDFSSTRKGCRLFLESVAKLMDCGHEFKAVIAGNGNLLEECQIKYSKYRNIEFAGRIPDPVSFIRKCDLAVVPSYADSCPNTVMEALYAGTPVIGSIAGGIPEILDNQEALFELDAEHLCDRIQMYMNPSNRENLQQQQKQRTQELTFDWVQKILSIVVR